MSNIHHSIDYIEITVTDMPAAKAFYSSAFGWELVDYGPAYVGIRGEDREVGGLALAHSNTQGGPLVVLFSENLDGTRESIRAAGGKILVEPFDFPGGRRFHFADPSGNELAVWAKLDDAAI